MILQEIGGKIRVLTR